MSVSLVNSLWTEMAPRAGRLEGALTITGLVLVTSTISMALRVPEAALSCYLIFYAYRDNLGDTIFTAVKLTAAASLALFLGVLLLRVTVDHSMLRVGALLGISFLGMYLSQASKLGPLAGTAAFVFAFMLTLIDVVQFPEAMSYAMEWIWVVLAMPMGVMAFWAAIAGRRPLDCAEEKIAERINSMADPQGPRAQELLNEGMVPLDKYLKFSRITGDTRGKAAAQLAYRADDSYYRLALAEAGITLHHSQDAPRPDPVPFLVPDAFTNPRYFFFALKVALAVLITYGFYTAYGLFQIHTAMITCYYVAMGSHGETNHRIVLRITGAMMGALAGFITMMWLMPKVDDIGGLLLILAGPTFLAAWIGLGSERISYAGWQLALCFYLVALTGFGPPNGIEPATGRLIGILFGSGVIIILFTTFWPNSAHSDALQEIDRMDEALIDAPTPQCGRDIARLRAPLASAIRLTEMANYEHSEDLVSQITAAKARYNAFLRRTLHAVA